MEKKYEYIPRKIAIGFQEGACPLKCKKCWAFGKGRHNSVRKMDLENAKKLIDEISRIKTKESIRIQPHIQAEPFTNPDFMEIVDYCRERNVSMNIVTNGILINDKWMEYITNKLGEGFQISFSLDAVSQEVYEKVRGNYSLSQLENKVNYVLKHRKNSKLRVLVNFVIEADNEMETKLFLDKWKDVADAVSIGTALDTERKIPIKYRRGEYDQTSCPNPFDTMAIDWNGDVRVCQFDAFGETNQGNVFDEGILAAWNNEKMNSLRNRHNNCMLEKSEFCYGCEGRYLFGLQRRDTENYIIKEGKNMVFFNHK